MAYIKLGITGTLIFLLLACVGNREISLQHGLVTMVAKDFDTSTCKLKKSTRIPEFKIWYLENCIIEEIKRTHHHTDSNGNYTMKVEIVHYTYVDLKNNYLYDYGSFSDTSSIIRKYSIKDRQYIHGWHFFNYQGGRITRPIKVLGDTLINSIPYNYYELFITNSDTGTYESKIIAFTRCDKKGAVIEFAKSIDTSFPCPLTRMDYVPQDAAGLPLSFEIEFVREKLTSEELKVFQAWERNAKQNPVNN